MGLSRIFVPVIWVLYELYESCIVAKPTVLAGVLGPHSLVVAEDDRLHSISFLENERVRRRSSWSLDHIIRSHQFLKCLGIVDVVAKAGVHDDDTFRSASRGLLPLVSVFQKLKQDLNWQRVSTGLPLMPLTMTSQVSAIYYQRFTGPEEPEGAIIKAGLHLITPTVPTLSLVQTTLNLYLISSLGC